MRKLATHARLLLREEGGFTLAELMVTIMLMLTVMFALYSIFDMSLRVFSFGNDKTEAVENARLGLERMEREIRAAYPHDKASGNNTLFPSYAANPANSITFGNDLDGDRQIAADISTEEITYSLDGSDLERNGQSLAQSVTGLQFDYLRADGAPATSESEARIVKITLTTRVDRGLAGPATQTLTTDVTLRNRAG
jgi:Tfp pilus assembly protein PilW